MDSDQCFPVVDYHLSEQPKLNFIIYSRGRVRLSSSKARCRTVIFARCNNREKELNKFRRCQWH